MGMQIYKPSSQGNLPFIFKLYDSDTKFREVIDDDGTWSYLDYFTLGEYGNGESISGILNIANYGAEDSPQQLTIQLQSQQAGQYIAVSNILSAGTIATLFYKFRRSFVFGGYSFTDRDYSGNITGRQLGDLVEPFPFDSFDIPNDTGAQYSFYDILDPTTVVAVRYNSALPSSGPSTFGNKNNNFLFLS